MHINVLSKGINEFSAVKHDFYNVLQTYNGCLEIGDLDSPKRYHSTVIGMTTNAGNSVDMGRRMAETPAFVSLLTNKVEYDEKMNVEMTLSLRCSTEDLYIDNLTICRCIGCLLDNAIEAAAISEQRQVFLSLEQKKDDSKLLIITNNTEGPVDTAKFGVAGATSKQGHRGLGLSNAKKALKKHGNCTFNMSYYDFEVSVYIELRKT